MRIETLKTELEQFFGVTIAPEYDIHRLARRLDIPLEEPEPTLEERHPRPWRYDHLDRLFYDGRGGLLKFHQDLSDPLMAAWNLHPLLLEIAEAANRVISCWLSTKPVSLKYNLECQALESKLHRLRLAQREEGS